MTYRHGEMCRVWKNIRIEDARNEYNSEFNGDPDFDEYCGEGDLCGGCAASQTASEINQGRAIFMMNGDEDYDDDFVQKHLGVT
ncbi:hypothetical protein [Streptomyces brasiliensis]|uniref:hypothetical protein n=1 Tax=Streptomyces brasiliensis TaxID=1954 RepID=UPI00166F7B6C|nr:hypothetical protein [Streptomyces brasiliensis]